MSTPDDDRWFWQQNVNYAREIGRAIQGHVREASPTTRALEPLKLRITSALDTLTALDRFAKNAWRADGMTLLRVMYDAHLQALYILQDPAEADERARLFLDFLWIEQRRKQEIIEKNPTELARTLLRSPKRAQGEAEREANYRELRPRYLKRDGKDRAHWYPGTLRDLARAVGLESEYEIIQNDLSGAIHSSPTALLAGPSFATTEHILLVGWKLMFRVHGRIAEYHGVPLAAEHAELARDAMSNLYDLPGGGASRPREEAR